MSTSPRFFFGYTSQDRQVAFDVERALMEEGLSPIILPQVPEASPDRKSTLGEFLSAADFFLLFLSRNSVNDNGHLDEDLREELNTLWKSGDNSAYLIPMKCDDVIEVPQDLRAFQVIDLRSELGYQHLFQLIAEVRDCKDEFEINDERLLASDADEIVLAAETPPRYAGATNLFSEGLEDPTSIDQWEHEIRLMLAGNREDDLLTLGVRDYIEGVLGDAEDYETSQIAFQSGLIRVVQAWSFTAWKSSYSQGMMLKLIQYYRPNGASVFLFQLLQHLQRFPSAYPGVQEKDQDVHYLALLALESYFPFPPLPADQSPAYKTYVDLLKDESVASSYVDHAVARLVALREIDLHGNEGEEDDRMMRRLIRANKATVAALVTLLLDRHRRFEEEVDLGRVYAHCLKDADVAEQLFDAEEAFEGAVASCGGIFERRVDRPVIHISKRTINLAVPKGIEHIYFEVTLKKENLERGRQKFYSLSATR